MDYEGLVQFTQEHFADGLALVIGSGLSAAEGLSGMGALASHLERSTASLAPSELPRWETIRGVLASGRGLEAALLEHPPTPELEEWIGRETCALLIPEEKRTMARAVLGETTLRLTQVLRRVLRPAGGLPIVTTNYDRLVELACELAGFHVDTTAVGHYAGAFDPTRSAMGSARAIVNRGRTPSLEHFPRAMVLKPHGSFDWYPSPSGARRCSLDLEGERLIITPGMNKYRAGYASPFDKHRELANHHLNQAARLLVVGYGFNDDHLQTHLVRRIEEGTPTLILNREATPTVRHLASRSPRCVVLSRPTAEPGVEVHTHRDASFRRLGADLWDLGVLAEELLA